MKRRRCGHRAHHHPRFTNRLPPRANQRTREDYLVNGYCWICFFLNGESTCIVHVDQACCDGSVLRSSSVSGGHRPHVASPEPRPRPLLAVDIEMLDGSAVPQGPAALRNTGSECKVWYGATLCPRTTPEVKFVMLTTENRLSGAHWTQRTGHLGSQGTTSHDGRPIVLFKRAL